MKQTKPGFAWSFTAYPRGSADIGGGDRVASRLALKLVGVGMAFLCSPCWAADVPVGRVSVVHNGSRVSLPSSEISGMLDGIAAFFASCSLDSKSDPPVFATHDAASDWNAAAKQPHLYAEFSQSLSVARRHASVRVAEALIPLDVGAPYWFTRDSGVVVAWTKCTWPATRRILCSKSVLPYLARASQDQCATLR
jgi:hypothetical protein